MSLVFSDGEGDNTYLQIAQSEDIRLNGAFTVEWFQFTEPAGVTETTYSTIFYTGRDNALIDNVNNTYFAVRYYNNLLQVVIRQNVVLSVTTPDRVNEWVHVAVTRDVNGIVRVFMDGVLRGSVKNKEKIYEGLPLFIGRCPANVNTAFGGKITNFRWIKGNSIYTEAFTVSKTPLPNTTNTKILLLAHRADQAFVNYSTNAISITNVGVTHSTVTTFSNNAIHLVANVPQTVSGELFADLSPINSEFNKVFEGGNVTITGGEFVFDKDISGVIYQTNPSVNLAFENNLTFCGWIKPNENSTGKSSILVNRDLSATDLEGLANVVGLEIENSENNDLRYRRRGDLFNVSSGLSVIADEWNFVALSVSGEDYTIYHKTDTVDASFTGVDLSYNVDGSFNLTSIMIGGDVVSSVSERFFDGRMSQLYLFNTSFTDAEINDMYYYTGIARNYLSIVDTFDLPLDPIQFVSTAIDTKKIQNQYTNRNTLSMLNQSASRISTAPYLPRFGASQGDYIRMLKLHQHINSKLL